jgi:hypothetical protein
MPPDPGNGNGQYRRTGRSLPSELQSREEPIARRADIQLHWLREAQRLARLFLLTSERRHFRALIRHLYAMAERQNWKGGLS